MGKPLQEDGVNPTSSRGFDEFRKWALMTYGDSGKTKTVTRKKYNRIVSALSKADGGASENSKFRFWVKAKGFKLNTNPDNETEKVVFVPTKNVGPDAREEDKGYKRVAIVEDFLNIIYGVHVGTDGRGGKHAGQKRTYKAISEKYAFLPREAVTRFLMSCDACQKRMHGGSTTDDTEQTSSPSATHTDSPVIDFTVPLTTTYLNHMRSLGYNDDEIFSKESDSGLEDSENSCKPTATAAEVDDSNKTSQDKSKSDNITEETEAPNPDAKLEIDEAVEHSEPSAPSLSGPEVNDSNAIAKQESEPMDMSQKPNTPSSMLDWTQTFSKYTTSHADNTDVSSHMIQLAALAQNERKRRASDVESAETSSNEQNSETLGDGPEDLSVKDKDDEEDDEDDDDKIIANQGVDPERLKAFNMFVRLFVDENLDRMVPISKQPKEKVQAIIESCNRQFPDFHDRARKRIRTYLKSCRRMKRAKENGWDPSRPTPPHLTSALAESILAAACENESTNAKRKRMGLEPIPPPRIEAPIERTPEPRIQAAPHPPPPPPPTGLDTFLRTQAAAFQAVRPDHTHLFANSNGLFRPGFPGYQPALHHSQPTLLTQHPAPSLNGPTDLSIKKGTKSQLTPSEIQAVKQLVVGYRESAAFLYRSADELEQLLLQHN